MPISMQGKVVMVTGAGRGIGKGIARVFAQEGAKVLVTNRSAEAGEEVVAQIRAEGGEASFFKLDVSRFAEFEAGAARAVSLYGGLDVVCHNAGIYPISAIEEMPEELWDEVMAVNLKSTFFAVKAALPHMKARGAGRIVVTSSITGPRTGIAGLSHYAASKGGVNGFLKVAAIELARHGITVNGVEPGTIATEGVIALGESYLAEAASALPIRRLGTVEEIGYAALFLASDAAAYITGQTIVVDGGQILPEAPGALEVNR